MSLTKDAARIYASNQAICEMLQAPKPEMCKQAFDANNSFTRVRLYETAFNTQVLPAVPVSADDLADTLDDTAPYIIQEMEPTATGAVSVQYSTNPTADTFEAKKYPIYFEIIESVRITKNVLRLRNYKTDLRQVISDQQINNISDLQDQKFIRAAETAVKAADTTYGPMGDKRYTSKQSAVFASGLTPEALVDASKIMPSTPCMLEPRVALVNANTFKDMYKWTHNEAPQSVVQDMFVKGYAGTEYMNMQWIITKKRHIVPDGRLYMFAEPKFLGHSYVLTDLTLSTDVKEYMVSWWHWMESGLGIANLAAVAIADFNPNGLSDGKGTMIS